MSPNSCKCKQMICCRHTQYATTSYQRADSARQPVWWCVWVALCPRLERCHFFFKKKKEKPYFDVTLLWHATDVRKKFRILKNNETKFYFHKVFVIIFPYSMDLSNTLWYYYMKYYICTYVCIFHIYCNK